MWSSPMNNITRLKILLFSEQNWNKPSHILLVVTSPRRLHSSISPFASSDAALASFFFFFLFFSFFFYPCPSDCCQSLFSFSIIITPFAII